MDTEGCTALVTGANRGLGKAYADTLIARGAAKVYASRSPMDSSRERSLAKARHSSHIQWRRYHPLHREIGRGELYVDWIISGGLYVCVGLSLVADKGHDEILTQVLSHVLLMTSGIARIWIGLTIEPWTSRDWFYCSGGFAVCGGFVALFCWALGAPSPSLNIIASDILILGVSILGFGLELLEAR